MDVEARLAEVRRELDGCNAELTGLLDRRAQLVRKAAALKAQLGRPAFDPEREAASLTQVRALASNGGYGAGALESIFRAIFVASRALPPPEESPEGVGRGNGG